VRRSLHDKQLDQYHKLKAKKAKAAKDRGCRKTREYKKLKKFMKNVMKSSSKHGSDEGKTHNTDA
jgi:hypothetical protein